jgi:putative MFS transporter
VFAALAWVHAPGAGFAAVGLGAASFLLFLLAGALYLYTPELYPTHLRAIGTGVGSFCLRAAAIATPLAMSRLIEFGKPSLIYAFLAAAAAVGWLVNCLWAVDTRGRSLEEITP